MAKKNPTRTNTVLTLAEWWPRWLELRVTRGKRPSRSLVNIGRKRILPTLGEMRLNEITVRVVRSWIDASDGAGNTIRNSYYALRGCLRDAVREELIRKHGCTLERGELPSAKSGYRHRRGVYSAHEILTLTTSFRVERSDQVLYAILGLGGLRFGEAAALRWSDWDQHRDPLGSLAVTKSWSTNEKTLFQATKTGVPREVPVIRRLDAILSDWRKEWADTYGRTPAPDDLIVPRISELGEIIPLCTRRQGERLKRHTRIHAFAHRNLHTFRATFISLCIDGGAEPHILERVTHATPRAMGSGAFPGYALPHWKTLCSAVRRIEYPLGDATPGLILERSPALVDDGEGGLLLVDDPDDPAFPPKHAPLHPNTPKPVERELELRDDGGGAFVMAEVEPISGRNFAATDPPKRRGPKPSPRSPTTIARAKKALIFGADQ
jgi:integrase